MKKLALLTALCLFQSCAVSEAFAGAKLSLGVEADSDSFDPVLGMGLYQKLIGPTALNSWIGTGCELQHKSTIKQGCNESQWAKAKLGLDIYFGAVTFGINAGARADAHEASPFVGGSIGVTLW